MSLLPRYSRLVSKKIMVDFNPILEYGQDKYKPREGFTSPSAAALISKSSGWQLGIGTGVRYYFLEDKKINFFVGANVNYLYRTSKLNFIDSVITKRGNSNLFGFGGSAGVIYFLNKNIAVEAVAAYNSVNSNYSNNFTRKQNVFSLNTSLRNFINVGDIKNTEVENNLIDKNRASVGGSLGYVQTVENNRTVTRYQVYLSYAHFIQRGWLIGGTFSKRNMNTLGYSNLTEAFTDVPTDRVDDYFHKYSGTVFTRYYVPFPFVNRLFLFPQLRYSGSSRDVYKSSYGYSFGANYFLTKGVAIEAIFVEKIYNTRFKDPIAYGANVGIRYFLGK
ncbi:MAG: hypothetical protein HC817_09760 [Saprospiraceae bacterium]|nr:hypothetical protein [Saprospiraceae bacterium]